MVSLEEMGERGGGSSKWASSLHGEPQAEQSWLNMGSLCMWDRQRVDGQMLDVGWMDDWIKGQMNGYMNKWKIEE